MTTVRAEDRRMRVRKGETIYRVRNLEAWGNEHDGFVVNSSQLLDVWVSIRDGSHNTKGVSRALRIAKCLKKTVKCTGIVIETNEDTIEVAAARTGEPIFTLVREPNETRILWGVDQHGRETYFVMNAGVVEQVKAYGRA